MLNRFAKSVSDNFDLQLLASSLIALAALMIGLRALADEPRSMTASQTQVEVIR